MDFSKYNKGTSSVWAGESERFYDGATTSPIVNSVTFAYNDLDEWHNVATGKRDGYIYSRNTNPTVHVLEEKIRVLEDAEASAAFCNSVLAR